MLVVVGLESPRFGGVMADSHPNFWGTRPISSDTLVPTNEYYKPYVLKLLGDNEAAQ